MSTFVRLTIRK